MANQHIDRTILELAARACSTVHARDLRQAGVSRDAILHRVRTGWMTPLLPRTYAVGPLSELPPFDTLCMAGVLHAGPGSFVDGEAAARQRGVWDREHDDTIDISAPGHARRASPGFRFHHASKLWLPRDRTTTGAGVPVAGFVEMCLRLAATFTRWQLAYVIGRGCFLGQVTLAQLEAALEDLAGRRHVATLRAAIALVRAGSAGSRGLAEDALLTELVRAGAPEPVVNTRGALGMYRDEPDFVWHERRLNVEVDGRYHLDERQAKDDERRDLDAAELGYFVARTTTRDVFRRPHLVVRWILRALAGEPVRIDPYTRRAVLT